MKVREVIKACVHRRMGRGGTSGAKSGSSRLGGEGKYLTHHLAGQLVMTGVKRLPFEGCRGRWLRVVVVGQGWEVTRGKRAKEVRSKRRPVRRLREELLKAVMCEVDHGDQEGR